MPKTRSSVWLHIIWSTKLRKPNLFRSFRYDLFNYVKSYGEENNILIDVINGVEDHVHLLIRLKTTQKVSEVVNLLKGASSRWVNLNADLEEKFQWQNGYEVFSVSEKDIPKVRSYIYNQEKHHKAVTYSEELKKLVK
ncbi:MAG: IS200/IS605 family transposase [Balneola sp.]